MELSLSLVIISVYSLLSLSLSLPQRALGGTSSASVTCLAPADCSSGFCDEVAYLQSYATLHPQSVSFGQDVDSPHPSKGPQRVSGQLVTRLQAARPVAWVHVAKCGSSFANALIYLPGMCPLLPRGFVSADHVPEHVGELSEAVDEWCPGSFSTEGRINFQDHSGIGGIYESSVKDHGIIMLRQPEQRIMSAYYDKQHSWPYWHYNRWAADPLEFAQVLSGCAVRMLTREGKSMGVENGPSPCGSREPASGAEVVLAKQRLREGFIFVGLTEEWDASVCLLHAVFGGDCLVSDFINDHPGSNSSQDLYDTSGLMGFTDAADGALYEEASVIFAEQKQRYGVSYDTCQSCFQQALSSKYQGGAV